MKQKATCGSGGVAILLKDTFMIDYYVTCLDKTFEGILSLKLIDKISSTKTIVTVCYLPPEGSERGQPVDEFFDHLTSLVYLNYTADCLVFCEDINSRISDLNDTMSNVDNIPHRKAIDFT